MKSTLLSTLMLVAVGVQPVFAAQCQYGALWNGKRSRNRISDVIGTNG